MSKEELNEKLRSEVQRSQKYARTHKPNDNSPRQRKIAAQTRTQLPPQSPERKRREEAAKRRAEQELREKKRRRGGSNIVYYVMVSVLAVIIFSVLSVTVLFNTEKIIVEGESDYTEEQIIAASGLKGDENLVRLSTSGIPEKMLDRLVTLDSVTVEKIFPSTIKISVVRSVPMANFVYKDHNYVISHIGRVMAIDEKNADCMTIIGYKPADSVILGGFITAEDESQDKLVKEISTAFEKAGIKDITTVDITDNLSIKISYEDRVLINIGSVLQIDEKMKIIRELIYNGYIEDTEFVTLDVSDPTRAIQRPITTAAVTAGPVGSEGDESDDGGEDSETDGSDEESDAETTEAAE